MKLSNLVDFVNRIREVSVSDIQQQNHKQLHELMQRVCHHPVVRFEDTILDVENSISGIERNFSDLDKTVQTLERRCQRLIEKMEPYYLHRSLRKFQDTQQSQSNPSVLNTRLALPDAVRDHIRACIAKNQDWRWPGLIVRPGLEDFVTGMTAMDPLYLVDHSKELLNPALDRFPGQYQQRLACYEIKEQLGTPILRDLPQAQMGLCLLFYYFEFRPIEIIKQWLDELWGIVRPGGRVLFTYNNCDLAHGVSLYESGFMSYTPGHMIRSHALNLGFEIMDDYHPATGIDWMELRRPGTLSSIKASQTLAKVVAKSK